MKKLLTVLIAIYCFGNLFAQSYPESYMCYKSADSINVDGIISEQEWENAPWTNYFVDIEGDKKPKPEYKTRAKMLWDENYFYVAAEIEEPHICAKLKQRDTVIFYDNDFEVFIDPQGDNHRYYEFEMNALNTVWDLLIAKPYRDGAPAINAWDIQGLKSAVKIYGTLNNPNDEDEKWTLEIAFPWQVLKECAPEGRKPKDGEQWRVNFSRVNWKMKVKDGKYKKKINPKTNKAFPESNWVWSPQGVIAMHQPETWAFVEFSEKVKGNLLPKKDLDYPLKMELMKVYNQQKQYYSKNFIYSNSLNFNGITIETTSKQFIAFGKGKSGKMWYINQESKIWSE